MWLPSEIIKAVDGLARIYYIDAAKCATWNAHRQEGELRLLTGWCWETRDRQVHRQGFKTMTVAYRDAWYTLIARRATPVTHRLRLVRSA